MQTERERVRAVIRGGPGALRALWGDDIDLPDDLRDVPAPNLVVSSLKRFAQRAAAVPKPKTTPATNSKTARKSAEKQTRIVSGYDTLAKTEAMSKVWFRWYQTYGITAATIKHSIHAGSPYPKLTLYNPYDSYAGWAQPHEDATELVVYRRVPTRWMYEKYPQTKPQPRRHGGGLVLGGSRMGDIDHSELLEYHDQSGWILIDPESEQVLDQWDNPFDIPTFVVGKAPQIEEVQSEFAHGLGLLGQLAKFYVLSAIAMEDATFAETNVFGELIRGQYERGRRATNFFETGTRVEKPNTNLPYQYLQETDRMERQFRNQVNYSVQEDGVSPNSFVTGRGLDSLAASAGNAALEAQQVFGEFLQTADRLRLKWDKKFYPNIRKQIPGTSESYSPAEITDEDHTKREFSLLSLYDEPQKIIMGLQLMQAGALDVETFQENLANLPDGTQINDRLTRQRAEQGILGTIELAAQNQDPNALMVLKELAAKPHQSSKVLASYVDQLAAAAQQAAAAGPAAAGGPPGVNGQNPIANDSIGTLLGRLTPEGQESGAQVVQPF